MNNPETILRIGATVVIFGPPSYFYYLSNIATKRVGQDAFALMGPILLSLVICLPIFFYVIVKFYKGIRRNSFSQLQMFETGLLLFSWIAWFFCWLLLVRNMFYMARVIEVLCIGTLVFHYALWIYRVFIARRYTQ